jgi:hypothetical protein
VCHRCELLAALRIVNSSRGIGFSLSLLKPSRSGYSIAKVWAKNTSLLLSALSYFKHS